MKRIDVSKPWIHDDERALVAEVLASGWITQGPRVQEFEAGFAAFVGSPYAVAVSSGTAALHLALVAVGVKPGDIVVTVSHSFIATANCIRHAGAEPYFLDIDERDHNLDPGLLRAFLEKTPDVSRFRHEPSPLARLRDESVGRVGAILVVHQTGIPARLHEIVALGREFGIPVVEDAACAVGSRLDDKEPIGRPRGDIACFSLHPRKLLTTGDGGVLTTRSAEIDALLRRLRQHGMSVTDLARHQATRPIFETYEETGYNYRLTDLQAAMGIGQLRHLPAHLERRRALAEVYRERLRQIPGASLLGADLETHHLNWQSLVVRFDFPFSNLDLLGRLKERGVEARRGVMCAHREPPYAPFWASGDLPVSERASDRSIILPLHAHLSVEDVHEVCSRLEEALRV